MLIIVKKQSHLLLIASLLVLAVTVFVATKYLSSRYLDTSTPQRTVLECLRKGKSHVVTIQNDLVWPSRTNATVCDSLTIINQDDKEREISFGPHDNHETYDGVYQKTLGRGQSLKIELNQLGVHRFHDHYNDNVAGYFNVSK